MNKKKRQKATDKEPLQSNVSVYHGTRLVYEDIPSRGLLKFLYHNAFGRMVRRLFRKRWFSRLCGQYYDSHISARGIKPFIKRFNINMNEALLEPTSFKTFNEFFYRKLKPGSRKIDQDIESLVSPCDGQLYIIPHLDKSTIFTVKNKKFTLCDFLQDAYLANKYKDSALFLFRLAPPDYHRYHFPAQGKTSAPYTITGAFESVNPIALRAGVQPLITNERHITLLETSVFGTIAIISVGAMCVGKITETYEAESMVDKGEEMGYFSFGGSLIALLVSHQNLQISSQFLKHSSQGIESKVKMGEVVARVKLK